jgi:hypothetical protein
LVTGRLPFASSNLNEAIKNHLHSNIPQPQTLHPGVPLQIADIIQRATAKRPDERYQTVEALAQAMRVCLESLTAADINRYNGSQIPNSFAVPREEAILPAASSPAEISAAAALSATEELIIASQDEYPHIMPLYQERYQIGRAKKNDIVLGGETVSNRHLRMARVDEKWYVTDLASTNGAYFGDEALPQGQATIWPRGEVLRIGPHYLVIHQVGTPLPDKIVPEKPEISAPAPQEPVVKKHQPDVQPTPSLAKRIASREQSKTRRVSGQVNVVVTPQVLELPKDGRAHCQIGLFNHSNSDEHFEINLPEVPADWYTLPQPTLFLSANGKAQLALLLHVPDSARTTAGTFPLVIDVQGKNYPQLRSRITVRISIPMMMDLRMKISPTAVANNSSTTLSLLNNGNTEAVYSLACLDPGDLLEFKFDTHQTPLPPGETRTIPVTVRAKQRFWIGESREIPFAINVNAGNIRQQRRGTVIAKPRIPAWAIPILGLILGISLLALLISGISLLTP